MNKTETSENKCLFYLQMSDTDFLFLRLVLLYTAGDFWHYKLGQIWSQVTFSFTFDSQLLIYSSKV